jgi:phage host-nuclease inhibitor protein Gam
MLQQTEVTAVTENKEPFTVDTQEKAAWALRKLRQIRQKQAENANTANAILDGLRREMEATQNWLKEQNEALEGDASYFVGALEAYHRKLMEENPKQKTVKLPFGTLKLRAQQPEFQRDAATLLAWAKASRPDCVKVKEEADWATIKKSLIVQDGKAIDTTTGEIVPVDVVEREPVFSVEVEG